MVVFRLLPDQALEPDTLLSGWQWFTTSLYHMFDAVCSTWYRAFSGPWKTCVICDESRWIGDLISCDKDDHSYCIPCFEQTTSAMLNGDVAFLYDPDTTLPLCCFCPPPTQAIISAFRDNSILDPTLLRRWEQRIVSIQLQGLSLLTCGHCGYMVVDGDAETAARQPDEQASSSSSRISFRRRITQTLTTYILPDKPPTRFACPQCTWYTCQGCSSSFARLPHECRSDDLRLQMEKALDERFVYSCPQCSRSILKEGGCNHCRCLCGAEYCHLCHAKLQKNLWQQHFCGHFIEDGEGACNQCTRCPLYGERDDEAIRAAVEREIAGQHRKRQVWKNIKGFFSVGSKKRTS